MTTEHPAENAPLILVVDDDVDTRLLYATYLNVEGFRVDEAPDATSALRRIERQVPRVVLTDLMLPGISGFDLCTTIRSHDPYHRIGVVALSGRAVTDQEWRDGRAACFDAMLMKPCAPEEILRTIRQVMDAAPAA
jgi:DNA-binding response OmpR family regulator